MEHAPALALDVAAEPCRDGAVPTVWQRMLSGRRLNLLDPDPRDIDLEDIAHGLSRVARWNGQTRGPQVLSVAQHSLLVEAIFGALEPEASTADRLTALLHDAPEYVIGDLISPFKVFIGEIYRSVEDRLFAAVLLRFGLPAPDRALAALIKRADRAAAWLEAVRLAGYEAAEATALVGGPPLDLGAFDPCLAPRSADAVQRLFLARCRALGLACP